MADRLPYDLTEQAEQDIEEIFLYTRMTFGPEQAVTYVLAFEDLFMELAGSPKLGRERSDLRKGLWSIVQASHVVFYRIVARRVRISGYCMAVATCPASWDRPGHVWPSIAPRIPFPPCPVEAPPSGRIAGPFN